MILMKLQGWKWRGACGKVGPAIGPKWDPAQGEVPRPDTITEAIEHSQKGIYQDCPPKDLGKSQAAQRVRCIYLHPTNGQSS
jgi:hypothetical protein